MSNAEEIKSRVRPYDAADHYQQSLKGAPVYYRVGLNSECRRADTSRMDAVFDVAQDYVMTAVGVCRTSDVVGHIPIKQAYRRPQQVGDVDGDGADDAEDDAYDTLAPLPISISNVIGTDSIGVKIDPVTLFSGQIRMKVIDKQLLFISSDERDSGDEQALPSDGERADLHGVFGRYTYTVTFDEVASKFSFGIDSPVGVNLFTFSSSKTAYKLLGFEKGSANGFLGSDLTSAKAVSMLFSDALYLHCDLLNTNVDKRAGDQTSFHLSTAFAKIPINTSPFNNIIFLNQNDDYMLNLTDRRVTELRFWVSTAEHGEIALNDDFSFTLKVEVLEDDEKTLISQNTGLAELLRLQLLQLHLSAQNVRNPRD